MRRFNFYITVALLTFGIGSLVASNFYWKVKDKSANSDRKQKSAQSYASRKPWERPWKKVSKSIQEKEVSEKPFCKDEKLLPIWKQLVKDGSFQDWGQSSKQSLDCADMLEMKEIDLNQDGRKEFLLRGKNFNLCSAVGNCAFWIYEKKGKGFRKILYSTDYIDITEMPNQIKKNRTNNYFNIVLKGHLNASETRYIYYNFDGQKYIENNCSVHTYVPDTSNNPQWEFISCREYEKRQSY